MSTATLNRLRELPGFKGRPDNFTAQCPGHEDQRNSLSVKLADDGNILLNCHAGCAYSDVLAALDLQPRDLFPPKDPAPKAKAKAPKQIECYYNYTDAGGKLLFRVIRHWSKDDGFPQQRPDGAGGWKWGLGDVERVLYRLPEVLRAKAEGQTIYLCEGEKDADNVARLGLCSTTNVCGAAKWTKADAATLAGADVIVLADNDRPGIEAAWKRADSLPGSLVLLLPGLPPKGDVSDWIAAGGTVEALAALVAEARANPPERPVVEAVARPVVNGDTQDVDPFSELANAYRFKKAVNGTIMNCPSRGWMIYRDGFWQPGERDAVKAAAALGSIVRDEGNTSTDDPDKIKAYYSAARRAESARGVKATLELALALPGVDASGIEWDRDEWLVNVANGTVDVRTLTLMPHERSDYLTRRIPLNYDPAAACPIWESHLLKVFANDGGMVHYLQFQMGYSATASMKHQSFVICHGLAGCGKSTTIEAAMFALGDYADAVSHDVVLQQHNTAHACTLAALCGLRFGLVSELPEGARWNEAQVKRLATGDTVSARHIGQNPFSFKSKMKLWVNCNERPEFNDAGGGMARRIRCIPFEVDLTGPGRDLDIEEKLRSESPGILRWILEGARMAFEGEPELPEAVKVSSREYIRQNDILANFLDQCCTEGQYNEAEVGATHERFTAWGMGGNLSKKRLGMILGNKFEQHNDGKKRYWIGFSLR